MIEISNNLYVGSAFDFHLAHVTNEKGEAIAIREPWFIVSAARDPWHREALGYTGRGAPKDHPEYLIASRPMHLILNLVDVDDPSYIRPEIMERATSEVDTMLRSDHKVLIHCNQGLSRSPTIGLLYLRRYTDKLPQDDYEEGVSFFKGAIYPPYAPAKGMADYGRQHWSDPHA